MTGVSGVSTAARHEAQRRQAETLAPAARKGSPCSHCATSMTVYEPARKVPAGMTIVESAVFLE
jgi:hypothetical protein